MLVVSYHALEIWIAIPDNFAEEHHLHHSSNNATIVPYWPTSVLPRGLFRSGTKKPAVKVSSACLHRPVTPVSVDSAKIKLPAAAAIPSLPLYARVVRSTTILAKRNATV